MIKLPRPHGDRVLIEPLNTQTVQRGGIMIPEAHRDAPVEGIVAMIGTGIKDAKGNPAEWPVQVGDRVLYNRFLGEDLKIGDKMFKLFRAHELLAVIE